jgi:hypothetical protein
VIAEALGRGRNAMAIWQDLVDDHGFAARYASVRRSSQRCAAPRRPSRGRDHPTAPGEEGQVDYGDGPMVRDATSGKYRRTRLFVLTLGFSRKCVRLLTWRSSAQIWAELHERAFRRLGGTVKVIVLDNLREGVLTPDIYDPALNPLYRDVLAHYGVVALPCRVGDPDRKGKVEAGVGHAQKTPLKGLRFETSRRRKPTWIAGKRTGPTPASTARPSARSPSCLPRSARARAAAARAVSLLPLRRRTVHLDGCVEVEAAYYGAPPGWIGQRVHVQWNDLHVRSSTRRPDSCCASICAPRGYHRIDDRDRRRGRHPTTLALLGRARPPASPSAPSVVPSTRKAPRIASARSSACSRSQKSTASPSSRTPPRRRSRSGVPTYRFSAKYIDRRPPALTLRQVDPLIRQLTLYRASSIARQETRNESRRA